MRSLLLGIAIGALVPLACGLADDWLRRRKQRRLARNYLRRTIPIRSDG